MKVPAIERASLVLDALAESVEPLPLGEIVTATKLPKSTVHDLCESLLEVRLIDHLSDGRWRLSWRLVNMVRHQLATTDIVRGFTEACAQTAVLPGETVVLSLLDGDHVLYLACRNGNKPLSVVYRLGMRLPALRTASGKAMISYLSPGGRREVRDALTERVSDERWVRYEEEFREVRERGFSIDDEETAPGMFCIGAPIHSAESLTPVGAVAVSMVKGAVGEEARQVVARELVSFARSISISLGGRLPEALSIAGRVH